MTVAPHAIPRPVNGAPGSRFGAEYVLLDPSGKMSRGFSTTSARVWELMDGARSVEEIARRVAEEYGAPMPVVLSDVSGFIDELVRKGLVVGDV
jgi:hypothetical protein